MSLLNIFLIFGMVFLSGAQRLKFVEEFDVMPKILIPEMAPGSDTSAKVIDEIKNVLETYWFRSVVILIEDNLAVLKQAETYLRKIIASSNSLPVLSLMKFNSSGISTILANVSTSNDVFNRFPTNTNLYPVQVLEPEERNALFYSILKVVRLFSGSNAVLVFTSRGTQDEDLAQLTWKELLENQIKLYVVWSGIYPTIKNEEKLLKQTANLSGGKFFVSNPAENLSKLYNSAYVRNSEGDSPKILIARRVNITSKEILSFPIDSSVQSIHISVTSPVEALELVSPQGVVTNLLNSTEVERFSNASYVILQLEQYDVQLNTEGHLQTSISGIWRLGIRPGGLNPQGCNVTVSVQTHLNVTVVLAAQFDKSQDKTDKVVRLKIPNEFTDIHQISLEDKWGSPIARNVSFKVDLENNKETNPNFDVEFVEIPNESFYVTVRGKQRDGLPFSRISYLETEKVACLMQPLVIDVGPNSELIARPGQQAKVYFEVTNNQDQVVLVSFKCEDERSLLVDMQPRSAWLNPMQTSTVTVVTRAPSMVAADYRDLITFTATASGRKRIKKTAQMYVTNSITSDNEEPRLTYRYTSDCTNVLLGDCRDRTWTIEVTAQDVDSGLLQITSIPKGLYFPNDYKTGTKEPVVAVYGASCCQPKIQITAVDLMNNRKTFTTDAYHAALSAGSISAIVLGVLLFIILVIVVIILSMKLCCKKKDSIDLPVYRSPHGNTRER